MQKLRNGKSPGHDGLRAEHVKAAPSAFSMHSYPLALKSAVVGAEPLRWKGGEAIPLYKGKGDLTDPGNYRSVLVSELLGKRFHA